MRGDLFMDEYIEDQAEIINNLIVNDFKSFNEKNLEKIIDEFKEDKRTITFIQYYNSIVLDHKKINFGTFKTKWAIQGMTKKVYSYFDDNFNDLKYEIINLKDIDLFFKDRCCKEREEAIFCCKLFHVLLPNEFPPIDNNIIKHFKLNTYQKMISYKIIKCGYELYINNKQNKIKQIRKLLSKDKYSYIRINELSNFRIIDMIYWFILNRRKPIVALEKTPEWRVYS
jgi:hypothetical protein